MRKYFNYRQTTAFMCKLLHGNECDLGCGKLMKEPEQPKPAHPEWVLCAECQSYTRPGQWEWHYCIPYQIGRPITRRVEVLKKRWDAARGCWVLDTTNNSGRRYDASKREWVDDDKPYSTVAEKPVKPEKPEPKITAPRHDSAANYSEWKGHTGHTGGYNSAHSQYTYRPVYPWEHIDRKKWPATWWELFFQYHSNQWHYQGFYISEQDWNDRLKGIYKPSTRGVTYSSYYGGDYYD